MAWKLKRWSFNGAFWQPLAPLTFFSRNKAREAAQRESDLGIRCFLTETPDVPASQPEGETK